MLYEYVVRQGTKKPPMNGGLSQVIPITRHISNCSAFGQVCAVPPLHLVEQVFQNAEHR